MGSLYRPKYRKSDGTVARSSIYWIRYSVRGKRFRESAKTNKESKARELLKLREGDAARGLPVTPQINRQLVDEILAGVVTDYALNDRRSLEGVERRIRLHLGPFFGRWSAAAVSDSDVRRFIVQRHEAGASNGEINRELAVLRRAYSLAARTVTVRPEIPRLKERAPRSGFFDTAAFEKLRSHLPHPLQPLVTVAFITGWRIRSELQPMQWRQVDFKAGVLRLEPGTTKNGRGREFPFTRQLRAILDAQRSYTDEVNRQKGAICPWVFHRSGVPIHYFRRAWISACKKAGLATVVGKKTVADRIPHDFRRTAIRNLVRAGISEGVAMKMCGHETRSVFDRYNIITGDDLAQAALKLDAVCLATDANSITSAG